MNGKKSHFESGFFLLKSNIGLPENQYNDAH